jgi:hypothetical protein
LQAVNPGLNEFALSIGQELLIPGPEGTPIGSLIPTSTPIPLALQPPNCYRQASGGLWCIAGIHNPTTQDLENLVLEMRLEDASGSLVRTAQVFPPLNRLPAGKTMPWQQHSLRRTKACRLGPGVRRHQRARGGALLHAGARQGGRRTPGGGLSWRVGGTIEIAPAASVVNRTLVLVTAYDDSEQVVGYAVWEADPPLEPGETRDFAVRVFSLGPEIARVEMLAETYGITPPEE